MKIIVNPHTISIEKTPVNEKEINITKCEFEFAEEITNDFVKEAYFTLNGGNAYKKIIVNNECDIPGEVLEKLGGVELGVVAYKVENNVEIKRYNPKPAYFDTWLGSLKEAENSEPITPSEMEQYEQALQDGLEEVNEKLDDIDQALTDVDQAITETNNLDLDVSKEGKTATVTLTKKDATTKTVTLSDGTGLMFNWDGTRLGIKTDEDTDYTYVDLQGVQGPIGPKGEAFTIKKTYSSVAQMNADFYNMQLGDYVMIASTVEVEDNAKLYTRGESQWIFISDFSGATGIKGETGATPIIHIGTVTSGATPSVTISGTVENPIFNFVLQPGPQGETGATGNGIASITKTGTSGLVDTYTITYTDGTTTTFQVTNGEDGEVTQAQLDALQREVDYNAKYANALIKESATGTSITLNDTAECPMEMELEPSELEQASTTGANIQKYSPRTYSSGGNKYTCEENGQVTITGTGTSIINNLAYNQVANAPMTLEAGTYVLKLIGTKDSNVGVKVLGSDITLDNNNEYTFTLENTTTDFYVSFKISTGEHNSNFYVTLASGNTATTERYTNGPTPRPDYPQDIHTISGDNEINISNSDNTKSQTFQLNLGDLKYSRIGDYKDEFYLATESDTGLTAGKWYLKKNILKTSDVIGSLSKTISDMVSNTTVYSYCGGTVNETTITYSSALTVENEIYYPTTTPQYILLNDTLQSQLNEIYNWLVSYQDQTNIDQINNDLPFVITATTVYDLNKLINDLIARIELLEG